MLQQVPVLHVGAPGQLCCLPQYAQLGKAWPTDPCKQLEIFCFCGRLVDLDTPDEALYCFAQTGTGGQQVLHSSAAGTISSNKGVSQITFSKSMVGPGLASPTSITGCVSACAGLAVNCTVQSLLSSPNMSESGCGRSLAQRRKRTRASTLLTSTKTILLSKQLPIKTAIRSADWLSARI